MLPESLQKKITAMHAQAALISKKGPKPKITVKYGSSLDKIIKTKEQAKRFMRDLEAASKE